MKLGSRLAGLTAAAATALAVFSAWHSGGYTWRLLDSGYATYAPMTSADRRQVLAAHVGVPGSIFDFYSTYIVPGDRIYFQVMPSGLSTDLTLPEAVAAIGRFYLLPGVETTNLADATVVVSFYEDPSLLHVKFITQVEAGLQPIWVSRIKAP